MLIFLFFFNIKTLYNKYQVIKEIKKKLIHNDFHKT